MLFRAFWTVVCSLCIWILSLRYRIEVRGLNTLTRERLSRKGGILFLPNHPAHMDPIFVVLFLWPRYRLHPLTIEYIYRQNWIYPIMKLVGALSIPNFETSVNEIKIKKAEQALGKIAEGLRKGENFLLYPAGRLKNSGKEVLGGASAAHALIQDPETNVVLIRTTGLWGSSFSRALTGRSPDVKTTIFHGIKIALKNFIFFIPRRRILIEIEAEPSDFPREASRIDFNRYLEQWYNRYRDEEGKVYDAEPLQLVSYSFWRKELPEVYQPKKKKVGGGEISVEVRNKVEAEIRKILEKPELNLSPEMNLALDLGMDSLQIAELISFLGHEYDLSELHPEHIETVQNVFDVAEGARTEPSIHQVVQAHWPEEEGRPDPILPTGETIAEAFLHSCDRLGSFAACGDDLVGVLNYKQMKRAALVLAEEFRMLPHKHVGVLLPASVGAMILVFALQLAGKVPVMLNWTVGSRALNEMANLANIDLVISSWRFLERLSHVEFGVIADKIQLLEDIRKGLALKTKLKGVIRSLFSAKHLVRSLRLTPDIPAVILFTSGTEAAPKGVPLSHSNILMNQRSGMHCFDVRGNDIFYAILPPFHSFGFSLVGVFPFVTGTRVAFYPDPTDRFALAEGIERWRITILCSAPTFMKGLFQIAKREQLKSVRYFVSGGDKAPPELFEQVSRLAPQARLIQGYGITECSPVITLNRPNLPSRGVGRPLPDIELCMIHPETQELLPAGAEGEICVRGPNVFSGYLGNPRTPFITLSGKQWYRTGDLGRLDPQHNLFLSGRLKRFTKIGGEMISLGAIEEALNTELIRQNTISSDLVSLALCVDERLPDKPQLILFTTFATHPDAVNELIRRSGLSRLVKISSVKHVPEIPLLGIGKPDYQKLMKSYLEQR